MIIPPAGADFMREREESCSSNDSESENYYLERSRSRIRSNSQPRSKHIAIHNLNEEIDKIIIDLQRVMSQHGDALLRRGRNTEHSR